MPDEREEKKKKERQAWAQTTAQTQTGFKFRLFWRNFFPSNTIGSTGSLQRDTQTHTVRAIILLKLTHWALTLKVFAATDLLCKIHSFLVSVPPLPYHSLQKGAWGAGQTTGSTSTSSMP